MMFPYQHANLRIVEVGAKLPIAPGFDVSMRTADALEHLYRPGLEILRNCRFRLIVSRSSTSQSRRKITPAAGRGL